jgi:hypothetical protein
MADEDPHMKMEIVGYGPSWGMMQCWCGASFSGTPDEICAADEAHKPTCSARDWTDDDRQAALRRMIDAPGFFANPFDAARNAEVLRGEYPSAAE